MTELREIITVFWPPQKPRADLGEGVFLNLEHAEEMAGLTEGQHVHLVEPNELEAEGVVHKVTVADGRVFWFAEFVDPNAIRVIYREDDHSHSARESA